MKPVYKIFHMCRISWANICQITIFIPYLASLSVFGGMYYAAHTKPQVKALKKNYPAVTMVGAFFGAIFVVYMFSCILVFFSGIIFPILFTLIHASMRLRNVKNKVRYCLKFFFSVNLQDIIKAYYLFRPMLLKEHFGRKWQRQTKLKRLRRSISHYY